LYADLPVALSSHDEFSRSCSVPELPRIVLEHTETGHIDVWRLHQPYLVLGRSTGSHLLLPHSQVSRRHAYVQILGGRLFAIDLGSRTGISPVDEAARVGWVDAELGMRIGPYLLRPEFDTTTDELLASLNPWADRPLEPPYSLPISGLPSYSLRISGRQQHRTYHVDRVLTLVGRTDPSPLALDHSEVSKLHAALVLTPGGLWVVDLLGRGGVAVDGARVRHSKLIPGSELKLGPFLLSVAETHSEAATTATTGTRPIATSTALAHRLDPGLPGLSPGPSLGIGELEAAGTLAPVLQQIGEMQQQMIDQFHQSMMLILNAFGTVHRDTVGVLREELAELRNVTLELQELQTQAERTGRAPESPGRVATKSAPPGARTSHRQTGAEHDRSSSPRPRPAPASGPTPKPDDDRVHLLLQTRIAELQRERQSRWRRIMSVLQGTP
jgi:pSer/pThr/pTyr-binding forkhead associated (FHA) protein